jgi:hypothetical protein
MLSHRIDLLFPDLHAFDSGKRCQELLAVVDPTAGPTNSDFVLGTYFLPGLAVF